MRVRATIRKSIKWGGAAACVVLAVAWVGSMWWDLGWIFRNEVRVASIEGDFFVGWPRDAAEAPFSRHGLYVEGQWQSLFAERSFWWPPFGAHTSNLVDGVWVKLWFLFALAGSATAAAWRTDGRPRRRVRKGRCSSCGYDRTGVPAGAVCPECGQAAAAGSHT